MNNEFYIKLIQYSKENTELREKYVKGIIESKSGGKYVKGELKKLDNIYDKLVKYKMITQGDKKKVNKIIDEVKL